MGAEKTIKAAGKKPLIIGAAVAAVAVIAAVVLILINSNRITAISIRIQRLVGTVNLFDAKGKEKSLVEKMRLNSGHSLKTAEESLVMVSLDETKLLTLEEASRADIKASGKKLEFDLQSGSLFFNVNEKLEDDATFDIRTSTMVCGIRGTSAFIGKDSKGHETVMVTDGVVHVIAENPRTHEITEVDVAAGEMITVYLDEEAEGDATISIKKQKFREEDLPALAIDAIQKDKALTDRITKATGFSKDKIYMLHKATSSDGISMFGEAATALSTAGIDDAIPFLGNKAQIMIVAANSAADVAGPNLPLEETILIGAKGTVRAGSDAGFNDEEIGAVTESTVSNTAKVVTEAKAAGLNDEDLVKVAGTVTETINETVTRMGSGNYDTEHVNEAVEAIGTVMTKAVNEAAEGSAQDVLSAVSSEASRVNTVVETDVNRQATGEETVAAILGLEGEPEQTVQEPETEPAEAQNTDTENIETKKKETKAENKNTEGTGNSDSGSQASGNTGSSSEPATVAVTGVSLDLSSYNLDVSDTVTVTATVSPSNATNTSVTWSSSDIGVATVSGSGLTATVTGVGDGTATITATTADGSKTASFTATVQNGLAKYGVNIGTVTNGTVTSSVSQCAEGNPVTLTVTPGEHYHLDNVYANGVNTSLALTQNGNNYTFTMPAEEVTAGATFVGDTYNLTLNPEGGSFAGATLPTEYVYGTGASLPSSGTKTETAQITYTFDGWYTARTGGTKVTSITASDYGDKVLYARFTESPRQYNVSVVTGNVNNGNVTITDANGNDLATASSTAGYGTTVTVTATPSANCSVDSLSVTATSGNASVPVNISGGTATLTMPAGNVRITVDAQFKKNVTGVTLDNTTKSVGVGQTATLTATVAPSDAADKSVTWTVSPAGIVTVTPGTGAAANTATITGVNVGSATVTVTTTDGSKTATCAVTVSAQASVGAFYVSGGTLDTDYSYDDTNHVLQILTTTALSISNVDPTTPTTDVITVADGVSAVVTLAGVNIDNSSKSAFAIADDSTGAVTITVSGENTLKSGSGCAGLQKNGTSGSLTLQGAGTSSDRLTAIGGTGGAGIGGGVSKSTKNITILSGTIVATGGSTTYGGGAGIGGGGVGSSGYAGNGTGIVIQNGTITATGGSGISTSSQQGAGGSGIGGGGNRYGGGYGGITINGGTVTATGGAASYQSGAGIGGYYDISVTITSGNIVATGGEGLLTGAGIGTKSGSNSVADTTNITISGGTIQARGGDSITGANEGRGSGAGIGGGAMQDGFAISISDGTVTAIGGTSDYQSGAGIGAGAHGRGSYGDLIISGSAHVTAVGGSCETNPYGDSYQGAAIGNGGGLNSVDYKPKMTLFDKVDIRTESESGFYDSDTPDVDGYYTISNPNGTGWIKVKLGTGGTSSYQAQKVGNGGADF